jgi:hypothetical protein
MSEQQGAGGAGETEREMREHEREAAARDADERDPATGVTDPESEPGTAKPAPPETTPTGELGGGT